MEIVTLWSVLIRYIIRLKIVFNLMEFIKNITYKLKSNSFEGYVQNFRLWHWPFLFKEPRKAFMLGFEHNRGQGIKCSLNDVNFWDYIASVINEILVCVSGIARTNKGLWRGEKAPCLKSNTTGSVHFGFMMDKVAMALIRLLLFHQCSPLIHSSLSYRCCMSLATDSIVT
jgi:hypothetical protein